jgi:hypothetical protein
MLGFNLRGLQQGSGEDSCEHGNEPSFSIRVRAFFEQLSDF